MGQWTHCQASDEVMGIETGFRYHKLFDLKGSFLFEEEGFVVSAFWKKRFIPYADVSGISRLYYARQSALGISQHNPNQYRIALKDGETLDFCVAHGEEDAYHKAIARLRKKIYGENRLGVHLRLKMPDAKTRRQQDRQFENEKPARDYSLEKAMTILLQRCGLELDDQTACESMKQEKARRGFAGAEVRDENLFVELARLISGDDEAVTSEVFSCVERWEDYASGIDATPDEVRWRAVIDTLEAHGYAARVDRNDCAENIAHCLEKLQGKRNVSLDTRLAMDMLGGNEEPETLETPRRLALMAITLSAQRWNLCNIDSEGNEGAFLLCLLPSKTFRQCEKRLQGTGFSLSPF